MAWLEHTDYFWVVLCKNRGVHNRYNLFSRHAIPLAESDEFSSPPQIRTFTALRDDCGEENTYEATDILRAELEQPESLTPHSLFQESALKPAITTDDSAHCSVSTLATEKTTVLERIQAVVAPYLPFRHKESPALTLAETSPTPVTVPARVGRGLQCQASTKSLPSGWHRGKRTYKLVLRNCSDVAAGVCLPCLRSAQNG